MTRYEVTDPGDSVAAPLLLHQRQPEHALAVYGRVACTYVYAGRGKGQPDKNGAGREPEEDEEKVEGQAHGIGADFLLRLGLLAINDLPASWVLGHKAANVQQKSQLQHLAAGLEQQP